MSGRFVVLAALLVTGTSAAASLSPNPIGPKTGAPVHTIFSCRLPGGKNVTVTGSAGRFVYRYGTARRPELTIVGTAASRNVFKQVAVHGGDWDIQLRFVKGPYSYIVHSFPRNDIVDNVATSGLIVFRGGKRILDRNCAPWAAISLDDPEDLDAFPDIPEGTPSAWGD